VPTHLPHASGGHVQHVDNHRDEDLRFGVEWLRQRDDRCGERRLRAGHDQRRRDDRCPAALAAIADELDAVAVC
jgi:hypothetical protein